MSPLESISRRLSEEVGRLKFSEPVAHVYDPLQYAWAPHSRYLREFGEGPKEALFLGMNPGPFGMAQTGVPFGEVQLVREWMGIEGPVQQPENEHPKRPIQGFDCTRSEVSGQRLWGWARERFGAPQHFFRRFFVVNYCPLIFMEASSRNRTPDKLPADERQALFNVCDKALREVVDCLQPRWLIGVGAFAETRASNALDGVDLQIARILHPSPASPLANKGWAPQAEAQLRELGLALP